MDLRDELKDCEYVVVLSAKGMGVPDACARLEEVRVVSVAAVCEYYVRVRDPDIPRVTWALDFDLVAPGEGLDGVL